MDKSLRNELDQTVLSTDVRGERILSGGCLYRAFSAGDARRYVMPMFESGLVEELNRRELIARTWISGRKLDGYDLVLEHELISPLTLPFEWSFSMLQDAALAFLELVETAGKFGYYLKDSHPYNFVWKEGRPLWVDFGSFEPVSPEFGGFFALSHFVKYFYEPLVMWSRFGSFFGAAMLENRSESTILSTESFWKLVHPSLRLLPDSVLGKSARAVESFRRLAGLRDIGARGKTGAELHGGRVARFWFYRDLSRICRKWEKAVRRIRRPGTRGQWSSYHTGLGEIGENPRFRRILEILQSLRCDTVLELAGNSGAFSLLLAKHGVGRRIICSDYDPQAVDLLYRTLREKEIRSVTPVWLDIMYPGETCAFPGPQCRLRSEAALALAVTHHLILSQNIKLPQLLRMIGEYASRYVLIEFMPLGLYDGGHSTAVPEWYTIDWFRAEFARQYELREVVTLEENRILFVGEVRGDGTGRFGNGGGSCSTPKPRLC